MSGIGGVVERASRAELESIGRAMLPRLQHRGPDASGVCVLPGDRGVFAHTQLRIFDPSDASAQPLRSSDRHVTLVFDGAIYNFRALRSALERDGVTLRSSLDTEVILEQYMRHGAAGLEALDGMFSLALWDRREQTLLLMRDRFGKKPLYYAETPNGLLFGSNIAALDAHRAFRREVEPLNIPELLVFGYVATPRSAFKGVRRLPPATRLLYRSGERPKLERYWALPAPGRAPITHDVEDAKRLVKDAIGAAVRKRLAADAPLGLLLSGGIDSSIVALEMSRHAEGRVKTFSVDFTDDPAYDETRYAAQIAARFDTDHTELRVRPNARALLEQALEHCDEPLGDVSTLAVFAAARAVREHVHVVLTGDGGDEIFAGYSRFQGAMVADYVPERVSRFLGSMLERVTPPRTDMPGLSMARRFTEHASRSSDEQLLAWGALFCGDPLRRLVRPDVFGDNFEPWTPMMPQVGILASARAEGADRLAQLLRHGLATHVLDALLVKIDRMSMAASVQVRCPFLDTDLIELGFSIPSGLKLRFGQLKWLLREAYRDELPASVLDRKKLGFGVPPAKWWSAEIEDLADDLLSSPSAKITAYLVPAEVARLIAEHRSGQRNHAARLFALLQLELWLRGQVRAGEALV